MTKSTFQIYRFDPDTDAKPRMQTYTVDLDGSERMLLDALMKLKAPDPIDDRPSGSGAQRPTRPGDPWDLCATLSRPRRGGRYPTQRECEEQCQSSEAVHAERIAQQVGVPALQKNQRPRGFPRGRWHLIRSCPIRAKKRYFFSVTVSVM
jgi:hypothetical protein